MKILVYDVAAEDGGGLFILKQFYNDVLLRNDDNQWFFLVSNDSIKSKGNIIVKEYDYVKKSYLHRWLFESIKLKTILKKIKPDLVISLQNMPIKRFNGKQFIYLHQSLQFCPKRFSLFKSEERGLAFRQKIICNIYKKNLSKADHIFVQTNWIKDSTKKWLKIHGDKITIVPISVNMINDIKRKYEGQTSRVFFYPARAEKYKNHEVIIEACRKLISSGVMDFKVIFTINKEDGPYSAKIIELSKGLPIEFIGNVPYKEIWKYYAKTILLFPSYLETCGLPMLEVRAIGGRVIASDMPFSHENLDGYENVTFFPYDNSDELAQKMKLYLEFPNYIVPKDKKTVCYNNLVESMLERI